RTVAGIGSSADSTIASMARCCGAVVGTVQRNWTTSGSSGFTTGTTLHGWSGSTAFHPVLVFTLPQSVLCAGNVVLQKSVGSTGNAVVLSVQRAMIRTLDAGLMPLLITCT